MESLEMLRNVNDESTMAKTKVKNSIRVLKRAGNPSNTMNALGDLQLHQTRRMLGWFLNVFEKLVAKRTNHCGYTLLEDVA
ncbi:hypothetical protein TNCV_1934711 [Trichonephila clavipes]|nr:hypothetical protein TNCV_1934711 [Trichonephila clavipes]